VYGGRELDWSSFWKGGAGWSLRLLQAPSALRCTQGVTVLLAALYYVNMCSHTELDCATLHCLHRINGRTSPSPLLRVLIM
jgi:hypothetical protein